MNEEQKQSLRERLATRFEVKDLESPAVEKQISDALKAVQGVCDISIIHGAIHIIYDPLQTSDTQLKAAIEKTGHSVNKAETDFETPHPDLPQREHRPDIDR